MEPSSGKEEKEVRQQGGVWLLEPALGGALARDVLGVALRRKHPGIEPKHVSSLSEAMVRRSRVQRK